MAVFTDRYVLPKDRDKKDLLDHAGIVSAVASRVMRALQKCGLEVWGHSEGSTWQLNAEDPATHEVATIVVGKRGGGDGR